MISKREVIPLLLEACPGFQKWWDEMGPLFPEKLWHDNGRGVLAIFFTNLAWHLLSLHQEQKIDCFPALSRVIERLQIEGDSEIRSVSIKDFLQSIQCIWKFNNVDPNRFFTFLGPQAARYWQEVGRMAPN